MAQWQKGLVQWFDKSSGEGVVLGDDGHSYYVHYSTIVSEPKRSPTMRRPVARRNLDSGQQVVFQVYENLYSKRVEKIKQA
jgi:cold shock CspA family protein